MVNVEKGNILGAISKSSSRQVKGVGSFQMSYLPSAEEIGNRLTNEIINQMVRKLSPHYVTKMRTLEYGKDKEKLVKLGVVYAQRGLWEEALQKWNMALKINPYNASAYNNIGVYYEVKGLLNEALSAYKEALKINPTNKVYMENLSQIKREIAEQEKIRKKYKVK
jgi:tetratricopeptide (TPR) repeat protein